MKRKKIRNMLALTAVLAAESVMNQGAPTDSEISLDRFLSFINSETPLINAPKNVIHSIESVLDTLNIPSKVITKDMLRATMFVNSQNLGYGSLYDSIDDVLDTLKTTSEILDKDFIRSYIRAMNDNPLIYNPQQTATRNVIDTMNIDSKLINNKIVQAFAYVESKYFPNLKNNSGAGGAMQIMPKTWSHYTNESFEKNVLKPEKNIPVGVEHLIWLENDIPANYKSRLGKDWNAISDEEKIDYIAASYNGGHGLLYSKFFNIRRTTKETAEFVDWIKDARLIISLEDLLTFGSPTTQDQTSYDVAKRTSGIIDNLSFIESYLSKNYSRWSKADASTKQDLIVVASIQGPRRLVKELRQIRKDYQGKTIDGDFRNASPQIASRVRDVNDNMFTQSIANTWNYSDSNYLYLPKQRIEEGTQQLLSLENQLSKFAGWNMLSIEDKQKILMSASISGPDKIKKENWKIDNLPEYLKDKFNSMNGALGQFNKVSEYKTIILRDSKNALRDFDYTYLSR